MGSNDSVSRAIQTCRCLRRPMGLFSLPCSLLGWASYLLKAPMWSDLRLSHSPPFLPKSQVSDPQTESATRHASMMCTDCQWCSETEWQLPSGADLWHPRGPQPPVIHFTPLRLSWPLREYVSLWLLARRGFSNCVSRTPEGSMRLS